MSYTLSNTGQLNYVQAYVPSPVLSFTNTQQTIKTDSVRPVQMYLHSEQPIEPGHLVQWTGEPYMFLKSGERVTSFDDTRGHEHALTSVEELNDKRKLAGVVLEIAADKDRNTYEHAGVRTNHNISEHKNILRVATKGCVLAWVIDAHENMLDGLYTLYRNGLEIGQSVVRNLGDTHFTIEHLSNVNEDRLSALETKFAELTG